MTSPPTAYPKEKSVPPGMQINDFDQLIRLFSQQWDGRFEQLSCGRFAGSLLVARGQTIRAHFATANQSMRIRGWEGAGEWAFSLVIPASTGCVWRQRRFSAGCLVVRSGAVEVDHRSSKHASSLFFSVSEAEIRRATRALKRTDPGPFGWLALSPPPELFTTLEERLWRFLLALAEPMSTSSQDARMLEQACLEAAIEALYPETGSPKNDLPLAARGTLVLRAEDLMRDRLNIPTGEIDLCVALGVSGRTLRLAFQERFGLGPMAYYQTLRLNAARAVLKNADNEEMSVAKVARNFGFCHLGKFAGYYRRLFGERPSDTLFGNGIALP